MCATRKIVLRESLFHSYFRNTTSNLRFVAEKMRLSDKECGHDGGRDEVQLLDGFDKGGW